MPWPRRGPSGRSARPRGAVPGLRAPVVALLAALLGCTALPAAAPRDAPAPPPTTYLALGDSVAAGVGAPSRDAGYPAVLRRLLEQQCAPECDLRLEDLAVGGATTAGVLRDQLNRAREVLAREDVRLVTLTVGGNDVFGRVLGACYADQADPSCRRAARDAVSATDRGVDAVLDRLPTGSGAPTVAVMTYDDPLPGCRLAALSPLAQQVLEGTGTERGLNDVLRARAAEHGAVVVETGPRLAVEDLVGGEDCLHPDGSGHRRIAQAFAEAVQARPGPPGRP